MSDDEYGSAEDIRARIDPRNHYLLEGLEEDNDEEDVQDQTQDAYDDAYYQRLHDADVMAAKLRKEVQYIEQELEEKQRAVAQLAEKNSKLQVCEETVNVELC
jgi:hypothetical protein